MGTWKLVQQMKGPSHDNGGIDMVLNGTPVNVEGNELLFENTTTGEKAITPKKDSPMLVKHLYAGNDDVISSYIGRLKHYGTFAKDGVKVPLKGLVSGLKEDRDFREYLVSTYPGVENAYGFNAEQLGLVHDSDYSPPGYGNIEFMAAGNEGNSYPYINEKGEKDVYLYGNPNTSRHNVIYNDNVKSGDIVLDILSHTPKFKESEEYAVVKERVYKSNMADIDYFYQMDKENGRAEDGFNSWLNNYSDGKIRAWYSRNDNSLDLDDATRDDYSKEIISSEEDVAIRKYHNNVIAFGNGGYNNIREGLLSKYRSEEQEAIDAKNALTSAIMAKDGIVISEPLKPRVSTGQVYRPSFTPEERNMLNKHYVS